MLVIWGGALAFFWLTGSLLQRVLRVRPHPDWLLTLALQIGLGLAWWPLLFLWSSAVGLAWSARAAQAVAIAAMLAGAASLLWGCKERWRGQVLAWRRQRLTIVVWLCIATLTAATRLLQARGLALPPWVDPIHHLAILRIFVEQGRLPATMDPFIAGGAFTYHWGFHGQLAWLAWLFGQTESFALADLLLQAGQWFNVLSVRMVYAAGRVLFASRRAGLLAAALAGTVTWFPAYFLSWGRYTHLAGTWMMIVACIGLWRLRVHLRWGDGLAATLLVAGLALVHVRLALFAAVFVLLLGAILLWQRQWRPLLAWLAVTGAASVATLPWWFALLQSAWARALISPIESAAWTASNAVDWSLIWAPRGALSLAIASAGLSVWWTSAAAGTVLAGGSATVCAVALIWWSRRQLRLRRLTVLTWQRWLLVWGWVAAVALLLQLDRLGIPMLRISHINAGGMTLFLPAALAGGGLLAWVIGLLARLRLAPFVASATALALTLWGAQGMTSIVNPATVLARPADRAALAWIRANTPPDAKFAVNVWEWQPQTYVGSDGGYWIAVLTDRASILPPLLYNAILPSQQVAARNTLLAALSGADSLDDPALRARLRADGVTHLYLGARSEDAGSPGIHAAQVDGRPEATLIYRKEGVSIYRLMLE